MTRSEIARKLEVPPDDRKHLRDAIGNLETYGKIDRLKGGRYTLPRPKGKSTREEFVGTIQFRDHTQSRTGWFELDPQQSGIKRILAQHDGQDRFFVPPRYSSTALSGDRVHATLHQSQPPKWQKHVKRHRKRDSRPGAQRWEARIFRIEKRKRTHFVGTLRMHKNFAHVEPDDHGFGRNFEIEQNALPDGARNGVKVLVELLQWDSAFSSPIGRVKKILGMPGDAGVDILSIIHRHELPLEFPDAVLEAAREIPQEISEEEIARREDWRDRMVYTIDPVDARDFDDAICVTPLDGGGWEMAVFIADVSHYVKPGTVLDVEARKRGNSVYLVDRVIPMLPEALSNGICSLVPHEERITHAVIMEFDAKGRRQKARFAKAVIRSQHRYAYEDAFAVLQEAPPQGDEIEAVVGRAVHDAWALASKIRELRLQNGSLDLDFPEIRVVLDDNGKPIRLDKVDHDISHQLIEECMLAANEAVAEFTKNRQLASVYRVHEDPDEGKLFEFRELARSYDYQVGDLTLRSELQKLIQQIRGKPEEHQLKIGLLKSLKRAAYSEESIGHYGLSKINYTHFTSPIRRYADLVVHRVLEKTVTRRDTDFSLLPIQAVAEVANHLSTTERTAASAESESKLLKQFEYFLNISKAEPERTFKAAVMEMANKGIFVELTDFYIRGMIRKDDLPSRELFVDARFQRVMDRHGNVIMVPGATVQVRVRRVDMERKHMDFELVRVEG